MEEPLIFEMKDNIGHITFNRPNVRNAMNFAMFEAFEKAIHEAEKTKECRVLIMRGAGDKSFVSGSDIDELSKRTVLSGIENAALRKELFTKIERLRIPTIAAINGFALGIGCEIALCCTLRVAAENARFGLPEINLGIIPGVGGTQRLPKVIGRARAAELILTGKLIDASEALRIGLVNAVVPLEKLDERCLEMAGEIVSKSPVAVKLALQLLDVSLETDVDVGNALETLSMGICFTTEDSKEGLKAFLEKRKPNFQGK